MTKQKKDEKALLALTLAQVKQTGFTVADLLKRSLTTKQRLVLSSLRRIK